MMAEKKTELKTNGEQNTAIESVVPFECSTCHQSIRFTPVYMFNESGAKAQIVVGQGPAMIKCANCGQVYKWDPPTTTKGHDGGWARESILEDALDHEKRNPTKK